MEEQVCEYCEEHPCVCHRLEDDDPEGGWGEPYDHEDSVFADPGGGSALRAESSTNPRNLPCPTCHWPNRLTPKDKALGYQCDSCANALERGGEINYYESEED